MGETDVSETASGVVDEGFTASGVEDGLTATGGAAAWLFGSIDTSQVWTSVYSPLFCGVS